MMGSRTVKTHKIYQGEESSWGEKEMINFGYASDEERCKSVGLKIGNWLKPFPSRRKILSGLSG